MDEHNLRIFLFVTHSVVGALPLGLIICSDEKLDTLVAAFEMFKEILADNSFYSRGLLGPTIFMTDNCAELRDALAINWPQSRQILCIFHMLQQVWRWLHDSKNKINKFDRPKLLIRFKEILYAESSVEFEEMFQNPQFSSILRYS